jgi:hypothetical protein
VVRGLTIWQLAARTDVSVAFSADAVRVSRATKLFVHHLATVAEMRGALVVEGFLPASAALRFFSVFLHIVGRVFEKPEVQTVLAYETLRVDVVPTGQEALGADKMLVPVVAFMEQGTWLVAFGSPFLWVLRMGETGEQLGERLRAALGEAEEDWRKKTLLLSQEQTPATIAGGVLVKGAATLRELMEGKGKITQPHLFILERALQKGKARDESIKIYN